MQPCGRDRQELCVIQKNEVSCSNVDQNVDWKKLSAEKCGSQDRYF